MLHETMLVRFPSWASLVLCFEPLRLALPEVITAAPGSMTAEERPARAVKAAREVGRSGPGFWPFSREFGQRALANLGEDSSKAQSS